MAGITLTSGAVTITPDLRVGYDDVRSTARNVVHNILGEDAPDVTLRDEGLRNGSLKLLFSTATAAWDAYDKLRVAKVWALADDIAGVQMNLVRDGDLRPVQQEDRSTWILTVGFQEVA